MVALAFSSALVQLFVIVLTASREVTAQQVLLSHIITKSKLRSLVWYMQRLMNFNLFLVVAHTFKLLLEKLNHAH